MRLFSPISSPDLTAQGWVPRFPVSRWALWGDSGHDGKWLWQMRPSILESDCDSLPGSSADTEPLVAQMVKTPPAMQETWVQFLGWEDPLEKETETHSSILVWRIPRTREPGGLKPIGLKRVRHDWVTINFLWPVTEFWLLLVPLRAAFLAKMSAKWFPLASNMSSLECSRILISVKVAG